MGLKTDNNEETTRATLDRVRAAIAASVDDSTELLAKLDKDIAELAADPKLLAEFVVYGQVTSDLNAASLSEQLMIGLVGTDVDYNKQEQSNDEGKKEDLHDGNSNTDSENTNNGSSSSSGSSSITTGEYKPGSGE